MPLNIIFMGTPEFAVPTLSAILDAGHRVLAVYSQPPRPAGRRGLSLKKSPVHDWAESAGLEVKTPTTLKTADEQAAFRNFVADVIVVVAYGLLLPKPVLDAARFGALNGHASALPRWRGAAPIQRAIMAGDTQTAVMVMKMEEGLDTGPVALSRTMPIGPDQTAGELHDVLAPAGAELMVEALANLVAGQLSFTPQSEKGVTYAKKIEKAETRIDWAGNALDIHNRIRGLSPFPGAWCEMEVAGRTERIKVLRSTLAEGGGRPGEILDDRLTIACGRGAVRLVDVQKAGGKPMDADTFLRGTAITEVF